ncbi:STAS domain-containing protein, partial [Streptomyces sp. H34-S4]|uniref:STAS domain-containing protein n=1 Tax=Streptomyces sp. H34-S4 TaxID=2996463 RepID=UPI00226EDC33
MITTEVQCCGSTFLIGMSGELDVAAALVLQRALGQVTVQERVLMIDLHGVVFMDSAGLLLLLDLHRRAECLGLRVLVVGWQSQPQRLMAQVAGVPGPCSSTGDRFALAGFRRLIEERAQRENLADFGEVLPHL